jgi:hypothetical protein
MVDSTLLVAGGDVISPTSPVQLGPVTSEGVFEPSGVTLSSPPQPAKDELAPVIIQSNEMAAKKLRRSSRAAALADEHTLLKVERMAKKKNLEPPGTSFSTFQDSRIISNLGRVGINLNSSDVAIIKNLEVDRMVLSANSKKLRTNISNLVSDDEGEERLEAVLNHACGNFNENLLEMENDQIIDLSPIRRKKKISNAKNLKKGKLPQKPKTPSKIILK